MRKILTRNQFLDTVRTQSYTKYTGIGKTNEAFANDVNWGDSWVGILISSLNRKIKTKRNLKKMDGVISQIKLYFDELVDRCKINVNPIDELTIEISSLLGELVNGINNKEEIGVLIRICETAIEKIDNEYIEDKDFLINPLTEMIDFLKSLNKDDEEVKEEEEREEEKEKKKEEEKEEKLPGIPEEDKLIKEILALNVAKKNPLQLKPYVEKVKKSIQIVENRLKSPSKVKSGVDEKEISKIYKEIASLVHPDKKLFPEEKSSEYLSKAGEFKKNKDLEKLKNLLIQIKLIIKQIEIYNKLKEGDKKAIESEFNKKVESIYQELVRKEKEKQKKAGKNTNLGEGTRKRLRKEAEELARNKELVSSNESKISNYLDFIIEKDLIPYKKSEIVKSEGSDKETTADSNEKSEEKNQKNKKIDIYERIESKYNEIFSDDIKDRFEIENPDSVIRSGKLITEEFIITNENQIFELVRLFMRAWRIHTPGRIPSGRTDGRVAGRVFDQYEYVGNGDSGTPDKPGPGPYRNIEIYQKFETAMFDIMGDTKYTSTIFSDDAKFYFKKDKDSPAKLSEITVQKMGTSGSKPADFMQVAKPLGKILLRFMRKLIDDPQIYRKGAIGKFMDEYFNISDKRFEDDDLQFPGFQDVDGNGTTAGEMANLVNGKFVNISESKFESVSKKIFNQKEKKFALKLKTKDETYYSIYLGKKDDYYYFFLSDGNINKSLYISNKSRINITNITSDSPKVMRLVKMDSDNIKKIRDKDNIKFQKSKINFLKIEDEEELNFEDGELSLKNVEILVDSKNEIIEEVWFDNYSAYKKINNFKLEFGFKK